MVRTLAAILAMPYCMVVFGLLSFTFGRFAGSYEAAMMMGNVCGGLVGACLMMLALPGGRHE